uniref:Secreted protein n=1 Tax=Strongyloides papillosus TaxID=174720 RepID=A0A0N5CIW0_STREA
MKLAISVLLFIIFNAIQCRRPSHPLSPRHPNVPNPMLTVTGILMCGGVPDGNVRLSLGRKTIVFKTLLAKQFSNRKGQFFINV